MTFTDCTWLTVRLVLLRQQPEHKFASVRHDERTKRVTNDPQPRSRAKIPQHAKIMHKAMVKTTIRNIVDKKDSEAE